MVGEIFSVQAYHHLLTVVSSMITRKLNLRVYDSLLVLAAVRLYRVYRRLDTLPLYLYYELLIILLGVGRNDTIQTWLFPAIVYCCGWTFEMTSEMS